MPDFERRLADLPADQRVRWHRHVIESGDTLGTGTLLVEEAGLMAQQGNRRTAAATLHMALSLLSEVEAPPELADRVAEVRQTLGR